MTTKKAKPDINTIEDYEAEYGPQPREWPIDAPQEEPIRDMKMLINIRAQTHGDWREQSHHSQMLKTAMGLDMNASLRPDEREALELICVKIARILNGDAHLEEHWRDIAGYATLAADQNKAA